MIMYFNPVSPPGLVDFAASISRFGLRPRSPA